MILEALYRHYEDLKRRGKVSRKGWMPAKVSAALRLDTNGNLVGFVPLMRSVKRGKKDVLIPSEMNVPEFGTRSGKAPKAQYLCDNAKFFLGIDEKSDDGVNKAYFERAKERHLKELAECSSLAGKAVRLFFEHWEPERLDPMRLLENIGMILSPQAISSFWSMTAMPKTMRML